MAGAIERQIRFRAPVLGIEFINQNLRIDFKIEKEFSSKGNSGDVSIYNLNQNLKSLLSIPGLLIELEVGNDCFVRKLIFTGQVQRAHVEWVGADEIFTMFAIDGGSILNRVATFKTSKDASVVENIKDILNQIDRLPFNQQPAQIRLRGSPVETDLQLPEGQLQPEIGFNANNFPVTEFDRRSFVYYGKLKDALDFYALDRDYRTPYFWSIQDNALNIVDATKELNDEPFTIDNRYPLLNLPRKVVYRNVDKRYAPRGDATLIELPAFQIEAWRLTTFANGNVKPLARVTCDLRFQNFKIQGDFRIVEVYHSGSNWDDEFYTTFEIIESDVVFSTIEGTNQPLLFL